jgi:hypothetical protein
MEASAVYALLKYGTPAQRAEFSKLLPHAPFARDTSALLASERLDMSIVALGPAITTCCAGAAPELGAVVAHAAHRCVVELFESGTGHDLLPGTPGTLAYSYVNASNMLGRHADVLEFAQEYLPFYRRLGDAAAIRSLAIAQATALLNLDRLDEADVVLQDSALVGDAVTDMEVHRLRNRVAQLRASVAAMHAPAPAAGTAGSLAAGIEALQGLVEGMGGQPDAALGELLERIVATGGVDTTEAGGFSQLLETLAAGENYLAGGAATGELALRRRIREAGGMFVVEHTPAADRLRAALADLEPCLAEARAAGFVELEQDALWTMYLCHSRLQDPSAAADALLALRTALERVRSRISDPLRRGGAFSTYPHLFGALCEMLHRAGRHVELLEAMEAGKGRAVADLLTQRAAAAGGVDGDGTGRTAAVPDAAIYASAGDVPALCRAHGFHYLSWFVDDDRCYAVVVTRDGSVHAPAPVPIARAALRAAAAHVDPRAWGEPDELEFGRFNPDASAVLEPLTAVLEPLLDAGHLVRGDHLCIAPDDDLANVPFAYVRLRGELLCELFTLSRIHNAAHLAHVLGRPALRPDAFTGLLVPTRQNVARPDWDRMRSHLLQPIETLQQLLQGATLEDAGATTGALRLQPLRGRVVHFSTHGIFPRQQHERTPFEHSGLVLSDGVSVPDEDDVARGGLAPVLTPRAVLDAALELDDSHVSMMACVSGVSREGIGGDALGMEWAMIQAGAASVLSSHWYVSAELAATFVSTFYEQWLGRGLSRAAALGATVHALRAAGGRAAQPYCWAAFSLTGDWR